MKYSVACCYMTHDHENILRDVLEQALHKYESYGIDICICDDGDKWSAKILVEELQKKGATNIYYIDLHGVQNADDKLLKVLQGKILPKEYDYIWPCKDRVFFEDSFLERLCTMLDFGYDVVQGVQWEDHCKNKDVYTEPAEFYRDYAFCTTNWEVTIRKNSSMLKPIDWELYLNSYGIDKFNSFFQSLTLFWRLAEMEKPLIGICIFYPGERYISPESLGSSWRRKDVMYKLWIDRWVSANFSLPSCYDPYKAAAVKRETNLYDLFGSLEWMMNYHAEGLYDREIFEKYKDMWPYLTDIPLEWLDLVSRGEYQQVILLAYEEFKRSFIVRNYHKAYCLFAANGWFSKLLSEKEYIVIGKCFLQYKNDLLQKGITQVFDGIDSIEMLLQKYG